MKTKMFFFLVIGIISATKAQFVNIPDAQLMMRLTWTSKIDTNNDDYISYEEASKVTSLDLSRWGTKSQPDYITDLTGIEAFTNLETLILWGHYITKADFKNNLHLKHLEVYWEGKTPIDLSKNINLEHLSLKSLVNTCDFSTLARLKSLDLNGGFETIDISNSPLIHRLSIRNTKNTTIDFTKTPLIDTLECIEGQITNLDLKNLNKLKYLDCRSNNLEALDVSKNTELVFLRTTYNYRITSINLENNVKLVELDLMATFVKNLDLHRNTLLKAIFCDGMDLETLDLRGVEFNLLSTTGNPKLQTICINDLTKLLVWETSVDSQTVFSTCDNILIPHCNKALTDISVCEDFMDADQSTTAVDEYAFETEYQRWENGAPVEHEHAYKGLFWTEAILKNGFTASKSRLGNGTLKYEITQPDTVYEPIMLVFGSYADGTKEKKFSIDLSHNKTVSFDFNPNALTSYSFYVQLVDIHGNNLMFDKYASNDLDHLNHYQIGFASVNASGPFHTRIHNKGHFIYDFSRALCGETVTFERLGKPVKFNVLKPEIAFDYSQVVMVKLIVSGNILTSLNKALVKEPIEISNFRIGNISIIDGIEEMHVNADPNEVYTAYDLLGNYIGHGKESDLKLQTNTVYILKSSNEVRKKTIIE